MAAAQGAHAAVNGIRLSGAVGALVPGICAAVGQAAAEKFSDAVGIEDYRIKNGISIAGGMAAGAGAGALVGGPVGAAVGAGVGAAGWVIGKTIDAITISGLGFGGPDDNWCYITTGTVDGQVCFGTYGAADTVYFKTFWNEYRGSDCHMFHMSAGQSQSGDFQLCVWDQDNNVVHHLNKVFHRDFIHCGKANGRHYVAHGKGELWGSGGGAVDIYC